MFTRHGVRVDPEARSSRVGLHCQRWSTRERLRSCRLQQCYQCRRWQRAWHARASAFWTHKSHAGRFIGVGMQTVSWNGCWAALGGARRGRARRHAACSCRCVQSRRRSPSQLAVGPRPPLMVDAALYVAERQLSTRSPPWYRAFSRARATAAIRSPSATSRDARRNNRKRRVRVPAVRYHRNIPTLHRARRSRSKRAAVTIRDPPPPPSPPGEPKP